MLLADELRSAYQFRFAVKREYARVLKFGRPKFVNVLRWEESQHPRDKEGQFADKKEPLEKKRRDFMALVKRGERDELQLDRQRVVLADAWTAWSEDTKNRKRPLKPDGAAAKKLESYKTAKALEDAFHANYDRVRQAQQARRAQAMEMLKVLPDQRSKVTFEDDPKNPLHPAVSARAKRLLEEFRQFDGSGAFQPLTFPADKVDQFREIFGDQTPLVQNADGTYSIPERLRLERATSGRASASVGAVHISGGSGLEQQVYHEVAHHIEFKNGAVLAAAIDLRENVLADKPREVFKLNTVSPGLGDDEVAVRGKFPDPYTAKIYPHDIATEVISTGVESYLLDPLRFARERPEQFTLVFNVMQGKYR